MKTILPANKTANLVVVYDREPLRYAIRGQRGVTTYTPVAGKSAPVGRNAPCPCGSGRKFKKCCRRA